ncbi:MAG: DUF86 domain-containing protein [Deltaproteobacteria bacterium]|nr:DUF86 domain-containing protein [Deltaproteobacteria bacterium]MBI5875539.1 DUF86 domain-containing protein [Deltaproteobacteria bacterium]
MVFKRESIEDRLMKLDQALKVLEEYKSISWDKYQADIKIQWIIERGFIIIAEMVFDIGAHILSSIYREYCDEYEEIIKGVAGKQIISQNLAKGLEGFGGFRNVLIHEYVKLDAKKVYDALTAKLDILERFKKEIAEWVAKQG